MDNKTLFARVVNIHDVEANWNQATTFVPRAGELVVYDVDSTHVYPRFKIGDGATSVVDLPFTIDATISDFFGGASGTIYLNGGNVKDYN